MRRIGRGAPTNVITANLEKLGQQRGSCAWQNEAWVEDSSGSFVASDESR